MKKSALTKEFLLQRQSLPLEAKIIMSQLRIREWYNHWDGNVYVSFSGGKDSTVLLDTTRRIYPEAPAVFIDTGLEYPELRSFVKTVENVTWIKPKLTFKQVLDKYGYPLISKEQSLFIHQYRTTKSAKLKCMRIEGNKYGLGKIRKKWLFLLDAPFKISHRCCYHLKEGPVKSFERRTGLRPLLGTLADESAMRTINYLKYGCNAWNLKRPTSTPLAFWTEQDILKYLRDEAIPYASVYGDIKEDEHGELYLTKEKRTGCVFCMFGVHLESGENKFQRLKKSHPQLWNYCIHQLNIGQVLDFIGVPYQ